MRFEFGSPSRVVFGEGTISEAVTIAHSFGKKVLLVAGGNKIAADQIQTELVKAGSEVFLSQMEGEPTVGQIARGVQTARSQGVDVVIGLGGGSAMDTAKAIGCLVTNPGEVLDYLEVVGKGKAIEKPGLAVITVPTTAGTGSEVTRNAVLAAPEKKMKVSLRSPYVLPRAAVVDPELTYSLPPAITASTGMDALTQVLEPYVSIRANRMADIFCKEGMARIGRSIFKHTRMGETLKPGVI